jgi:hypothetical protein
LEEEEENEEMPFWQIRNQQSSFNNRQSILRVHFALLGVK